MNPPSSSQRNSDAGKQPMAEVVAHGLREAIMAGEIRPNDRIKQEEVAARFGVSRSPVREAFRELASEGFVELERDVGARVRPHDLREVGELYLAREAIEPLMIVETCRQISDEDMARARGLNDRSERYAQQGDIVNYLTVDREMHQVLLEASGLGILAEMATGLWRRTHRYRFDYMDQGRVDTSVVEHRLILDAIEKGDEDDAADLYRIHTRRTRLTLFERGFSDDESEARDPQGTNKSNRRYR